MAIVVKLLIGQQLSYWSRFRLKAGKIENSQQDLILI